MKKIVAVFLAVCMIELLTLPAYALDLENNKYILASEYKSADSEVQKRIEQDCNSFSQMGLDKEWVRIGQSEQPAIVSLHQIFPNSLAF